MAAPQTDRSQGTGFYAVDKDEEFIRTSLLNVSFGGKSGAGCRRTSANKKSTRVGNLIEKFNQVASRDEANSAQFSPPQNSKKKQLYFRPNSSLEDKVANLVNLSSLSEYSGFKESNPRPSASSRQPMILFNNGNKTKSDKISKLSKPKTLFVPKSKQRVRFAAHPTGFYAAKTPLEIRRSLHQKFKKSDKWQKQKNVVNESCINSSIINLSQRRKTLAVGSILNDIRECRGRPSRLWALKVSVLNSSAEICISLPH